jgi:hypothetical protein
MQKIPKNHQFFLINQYTGRHLQIYSQAVDFTGHSKFLLFLASRPASLIFPGNKARHPPAHFHQGLNEPAADLMLGKYFS